ncbi:gp122 [Mycobacterium phage Omega]|uniref:Uncharacterized protein n=1 Tax=Mycobacterium phage Omega TaxID=2907835 RepID=Q854E6_BPMOM|nr:gp122 [Mycobacterium phage Omega]AAN12762.1 hypothetical protein PBI_OMEGA_122 [Mycobacterium phage Omega]
MFHQGCSDPYDGLSEGFIRAVTSLLVSPRYGRPVPRPDFYARELLGATPGSPGA